MRLLIPAMFMSVMFTTTAFAHHGADEVVIPDGLEAPKKAKWDVKGALKEDFYRAELLGRSEQWEEAETLFRAVLQEQPGCGEVLVELADSLDHQDRHEDAMAVLHWTSSLFDDKDTILSEMASVSFGRQDYEEALSAADAAIAINPKSYTAQRERARALTRLARFDEAISGLTAAQEAREGKDYICLEVQAHVAAGAMDAANERWAECALTNKKSLKRDTETMMAGAERDFQKVGELARDNDNLNVARMAEIMVHLNTGAFDKVCMISKLVVREDPRALDGQLARGVCLKSQGKSSEALGMLRDTLTDAHWATFATGTPYGVLVDHAPTAIHDLARDGAYHLFDLLVRAEEIEEAKAVGSKIQEHFADTSQAKAVAIDMLTAAGSFEEAWAALGAVMAESDDTSAFTGSLLFLYSKDPTSATPEFRAMVDEMTSEPAIE